MDRFDEIYRERVQALLRAIYAARFVKEDSVPCQIEEVALACFGLFDSCAHPYFHFVSSSYYEVLRIYVTCLLPRGSFWDHSELQATSQF